jgi:hypothetical protein
MGAKDVLKKIMLSLGIAISPATLNAGFNMLDPRTWGEYKPGKISEQLFSDTSSIADTSSISYAKTSGGNFGSFFGIDQSRIDKPREKWEQQMAEIEKKIEEEKQGKGQEQVKKADMNNVNASISALTNTVPEEVLNIVLPAWSLSPATKASLQAIYGTGLSDDQYKQLLFWDEYRYAKIKAGEICAQLGIKYNEGDANEFAVAYASMATLGYGIGRPNMIKAVDIATATMQANVDSSQWSLLLVMQYLPAGIQTKYRYVNLDYPKSVISKVYLFYGIPYVDYGSGVSPVRAEKPNPGFYQPQQPTQPTRPALPPERIKQIEAAINYVDMISQSKPDFSVSAQWAARNKSLYQFLLLVHKKKNLEIQDFATARDAGLIFTQEYIDYYSPGGSKRILNAGLTPEAKEKLRNLGYSDSKISGLDKKINKVWAEQSGTVSSEELEKAAYGMLGLDPNEVTLDYESLQKQVENWNNTAAKYYILTNEVNSSLQEAKSILTKMEAGAIDFDVGLRQLEQQQTRYNAAMEEAGQSLRLDVLSNFPEIQTPSKQENVQEEGGGVPSADEVLEGIPHGYGGELPELQKQEQIKTPGPQGEGLPQPPGYQQPGSVGTFEINVGGGEITPDSVGRIIFQPTGYDYQITVYAYLGTLSVPEHKVYDEQGVGYQVTVLSENERKAVLEKLAEYINKKIKEGNTVIINEEIIKKAIKEATGMDVSKKPTGEFQDWKTAFGGFRGYKCDGTLKAMRRA